MDVPLGTHQNAVNCVVQIFLNVHFLSFILNLDYNEKYVFNPWFHRQGLVISEALEFALSLDVTLCAFEDLKPV